MFCECFASVFQAFCECFASVSLPISTSISTQIDYSVPAHGLHTWTQKSFLSSHIQTGADNFCYSVQFHRVFCSRFFSLSPAVSPAVSQQILLSLAGSLAGSLAADSSFSHRQSRWQSRRQSRSRFFFLSPAVSPAVSLVIVSLGLPENA